MNKPDSIIFDMDGTLWDPIDVYVAAWNEGLKRSGVDKQMSPDDIKPLMGMEGRKVLDLTLPEFDEQKQQEIYAEINVQRRTMIEKGLGQLFDKMPDGLAQLSQKYKLFIVSNCPKGILDVFMNRAGINSYITDIMEYGMNNQPKHHNIKILRDRHDLKAPIYVGDTDGDRKQSELAGLPFVFLTCGYGNTDIFDMSFDSFADFSNHFLAL